VTSAERGVLDVRGVSHERIGEIAAAEAIVLHELIPRRASLEEAFMHLTGGAVEFHAAAPSLELESVA
jgi:ABC-2 type transport system ATP-binding protein